MIARYHPSDESLARFAAGTLPAGPAIVVATHLSGCGTCRAGVALFEAAGGALLEQLPPTDLAPDAFERTLAMIADTSDR